MRISDWSSDVRSSDLRAPGADDGEFGVAVVPLRDGRKRPIADDPPRNGEGDHRRWWRGTGGAALRIKDRKHLACPSTMLSMVPLPRWGGNDRSPTQRRPFRWRSATQKGGPFPDRHSLLHPPGENP